MVALKWLSTLMYGFRGGRGGWVNSEKSDRCGNIVFTYLYRLPIGGIGNIYLIFVICMVIHVIVKYLQ